MQQTIVKFELKSYAIAVIIAFALISAVMVMPAAATTEVDIVTDADTFVTDGANVADKNYGYHVEMKVEYYDDPDGGNKRALIHFDLSSIPADATIDAATVHLYVGEANCRYDFGNPTYNIHRIEESWGEMTVTWNNQPGYNSTPTDGITKPTCVDCFDVYDVTSDVQDFFDGTSNYGWLIKLETESDPEMPGTYYKTHECENSSRKPYLEVTYTPAATPTPGPGPVGVPEFSPVGLVALIGVLSVLLAGTTISRGKRRQ